MSVVTTDGEMNIVGWYVV